MNVFVDYTHRISVAFYLFMSTLAAIITDLLNLLDGAKIPLEGEDLPSGIKDTNGKNTDKWRKLLLPSMNKPTGNSVGQGSYSGNNTSGQSGVVGSSSKHLGTGDLSGKNLIILCL